ncbi:MAG: oligosaccharide flippase family protein [Oscillospiraceae bacterium]|nr:oligosaccharide flippase family protein [Oscillospiraceae bacterium]
MKGAKLLRGSSADGVLLTLIKFVTIFLGLLITRLLSEHLSAYDYGTYSQILLMVSTVSSLTILGMMDGVNYFYSSRQDPGQREQYLTTLFCLQALVSAVAGGIVLLLPLLTAFENPQVKELLIFAAALPLLQNFISMLQILLVSVGKARLLAIRNLLISLIRLGAVLLVVLGSGSILVILLTTLCLDLLQILAFLLILRKNGLRPGRFRFPLVGELLRYCIPMGLFLMINTLNRDLDKYLILWMTDTETLAMYANASKVLPFDVIMTSFCTVLLPKITAHIAAGEKQRAARLYRLFLQIAYIPTTILCCAVLAAAPQVMCLLYSEKYLAGLPIFCIYVAVDLLRFTTITLILSASGKTMKLFLLGLGTLAANFCLNFLLYRLLGVVGPALATLLVTLASGILILFFSARELGVGLSGLFDWKHLLLFLGENALALPLFCLLRSRLQGLGELPVVLLTCGLYCLLLLLLQGKRLLSVLKSINHPES